MQHSSEPKLTEDSPFNTPEKSEGSVSHFTTRLVVVNCADLLMMDLPERGYVLNPIIPEQGLVLLYAARGLGKTWAALSMAYAVASGQSLFGKWTAPAPKRVLYIDGEMPATIMQERLAAIARGFDEEADPDFLRILTPDLQPNYMPNLSTPEGQADVAPHLEGTALVVLDNLATLTRHGRENETESWAPVQAWILEQRRAGRSVLLVHHAGKGGNQRGTSAREDVLDVVIALRRPDDYSPAEGARFCVHLEKARGFSGPEAEPFEVQLHLEDGTATWAASAYEDAELVRIKELVAEGKKSEEIIKEMGISRATYFRRQKEIRNQQ